MYKRLQCLWWALSVSVLVKCHHTLSIICSYDNILHTTLRVLILIDDDDVDWRWVLVFFPLNTEGFWHVLKRDGNSSMQVFLASFFQFFFMSASKCKVSEYCCILRAHLRWPPWIVQCWFIGFNPFNLKLLYSRYDSRTDLCIEIIQFKLFFSTFFIKINVLAYLTCSLDPFNSALHPPR